MVPQPAGGHLRPPPSAARWWREHFGWQVFEKPGYSALALALFH